MPIAFLSGDAVVQEETRPFAPDAVTVTTKESITRFSALNLHPAESCALIRNGSRQAMEAVGAGQVAGPGIQKPAVLDLEFQTGDMAEVATWAKGAERSAERSVQIKGDNLLSMFDAFVAVNYITRQAGGR